ncbi:MAG: DNA/RNA non-specific endonuclease [Planctomycetota bacterium]|nr:DNA/RNA non-specific endonuclease [Planctomycetota bacterium]
MANDRQKTARWWIPLAGVLVAGAIVGGCLLIQSNPQANQPATQPVATGQSQGAYRQYIYGGLPKTTQGLKLLTNQGYLVGYSEKHRDPVWVAYRLFKVANAPAIPRPKKFTVDDRTEAKVKSSDYSSTGYDRGHMAPNHAIATRYGADAQVETFLMSNVCPQRPNLNRRVWERLEALEADDYANRFEELWVVDGPIFDDQPEKLAAGIDVPRAFFKIIVDEAQGRPRMLGFIMPQTVRGDESPRMFLVADIEKQTGLDFFTDLPKDEEQKLEAQTPQEMWQ